MSLVDTEWLALTEASERLGVHPSTLRRWADDGTIPCFRTPGGHRRFKAADLQASMARTQPLALIVDTQDALQKVLGFTRNEMAQRRIPEEAWFLAFEQEKEQRQLRDNGRRLFGLALQYVARATIRESVLYEGRRLGAFFGERAARRGVSLVDMVRAFSFYRDSLLRATDPGLIGAWHYDEEAARIQRELRLFMDEAMYAGLARYESICFGISRLASGSLFAENPC